MSDIFISYASEDRPYAERLAHALEARGMSVWWDREIPAGKKYAGVIDEAIKNTRCMVVLWSAISTKKDWVLEEAEDGKNRGVLVPILIEKVRLPRGFRRIQAIDLIGWDGSPAAPAFEKLLADTATLLDPTSNEMERDVPHLAEAERGDQAGADGTLVENREKKRLRSILLSVSTVAVVILAFIAWRQSQLDKTGEGEIARNDSVTAPGLKPSTPILTFPPIDPSVLARYCIRGNHQPPATAFGSISAGDSCHTERSNDGYYEGWRVRVPSKTVITFSLSSVFDSFLVLYLVGNVDDPLNSLIPLDNDDNSGGDRQAQLAAELEPDIEYIIVVGGSSDVAQGTYVLNMN